MEDLGRLRVIGWVLGTISATGSSVRRDLSDCKGGGCYTEIRLSGIFGFPRKSFPLFASTIWRLGCRWAEPDVGAVLGRGETRPAVILLRLRCKTSGLDAFGPLFQLLTHDHCGRWTRVCELD